MATISVNNGMTSETIASLIAGANAGDEVVFDDGLYTDVDANGKVVYARNTNGTSEHPVVIKSATKYGAVIDGRNTPSGVGVVHIYLSSWVVFDGFEVCYGGGPSSVPDTERLNAHGIYLQNASDSVVQNCYVHHCGSYVNLKGNIRCTFRYNHVYKNGFTKDVTGGTTHQFYLNGNTDLLFEYNISEEGRDSFIHLNALYSTRVTIRNNLSLNDGGPSDSNCCVDVVWENNLILNLAPVLNSSLPILACGSNYDDLNSTRTVVKNNTMVSSYLKGGVALIGTGYRRSYPTKTAVDCALFNNIIIISADAPTSQIIEDYGTDNVKENNFGSLYSLSLLQELFVNPTTNFGFSRPFSAQQVFDQGYWNLKNDVRVVGMGRRQSSNESISVANATSPATDIRGGTRPIPNPGGTYDIGAYQYASKYGEEYKWPYFCVSTRDVSVGTGWTLEGAGTIGEAVNGDPTVDADAVYATTATTGDTFTVGLSAWPSNWPQSPTSGGTHKRWPKEE